MNRIISEPPEEPAFLLQGEVPRIEVRPPGKFRATALLVIWTFGLSLLLPVLISLFAVSLVPLGIHTLLIPLMTLIATAFFIPFGQGNLFIRNRVKNFSLGQVETEAFVVQLTLRPRLHRGLRGLLEDADDLGRLTLRPSGVAFEGDATTLWVPYSAIVSIQGKNIGARGRYISGGRILLEIRGLGNFEGLEIADRSTLLSAHASERSLLMLDELRKRVAT